MSVVKRTSSVSSTKSYRFKRVNQYTMKQMLGNGTFGVVNLCEDNDTKQLYAMKIIKRTKLKTWAVHGTKDIQVNEMEIMKSLVHQNIVRLYEIIDDPVKNKIYLVMDYLSGGTLAEKLEGLDGGL